MRMIPEAWIKENKIYRVITGGGMQYSGSFVYLFIFKFEETWRWFCGDEKEGEVEESGKQMNHW